MNVNVSREGRGRGSERRGGAVRERDISGCDSLERERERDGGNQTRAELTACSGFQCEAESVLGATVTRGQYSVNTNKTQVCQHTCNTLICLSKQICQPITEFSDGESTGVKHLQLHLFTEKNTTCKMWLQ